MISFLLRLAATLGMLAAAAPSSAQVVTVGAPERPPFTTQGADETWEGMGVDLWRMVAEEAGLAYKIVPVPDEMLGQSLANGIIDVALAVDATPNAATEAELTMPYFTATLAIAKESEFAVWRVIQNMATWEFLRILVSLSVLLLAVGALIWAVERKRNREQFHERPLRGLGDGFWWAGVTLTTIGYGDKAPVTAFGRAVAMLWMLIGLAVSAALTAAVISATNVTGTTTLRIPADLNKQRIAVIPGGSAEEYLSEFSITLVPVETFEDGIEAVEEGLADGVAGSAPELDAAIRRKGANFELATTRQDPQYVTFGLSPHLDDATAEAIARSVLARINSDDWWMLVNRYIPEDT